MISGSSCSLFPQTGDAFSELSEIPDYLELQNFIVYKMHCPFKSKEAKEWKPSSRFIELGHVRSITELITGPPWITRVMSPATQSEQKKQTRKPKSRKKTEKPKRTQHANMINKNKNWGKCSFFFCLFLFFFCFFWWLLLSSCFFWWFCFWLCFFGLKSTFSVLITRDQNIRVNNQLHY